MLFVIIVCFLVPCMFTKRFQTQETIGEVEQGSTEEVKEEKQEEKQAYPYQEYATIQLLHTDTNQIEEVALDEYLYHVVSAEMPVTFEKEALKAQAVVARTYTIYKLVHNKGKHEGADICSSSTCCQAWISKEDRLARWEEEKREENWNKIVECVNETAGKIITYEGEPINAFFHSNSGGTTEVPFNVWGGSGYPYLQVVQTAGEEAYSQYASEAKFTKEELIQKIKEKHNEIQIQSLEEIQVVEKTESGRVKTVKIGNVNLSGVEARTLLGLRSTNFDISVQENQVVFSVIRIWAWSGNESNRSRCTSKRR